jgi:hypothetical protein
MNVAVLYRPNSEHSRLVEEFMREFGKIYPDHRLDVFDLNTREGSNKAEVYGVMQYPAILALTTEGHLLKDWQGEPLPLMSEVAYYAGS